MFEWSVECCVYGSICVFLVITASLHSFDEANLSPYCEVSPNVEWHACEVHKFCWSELMVLAFCTKSISLEASCLSCSSVSRNETTESKCNIYVLREVFPQSRQVNSITQNSCVVVIYMLRRHSIITFQCRRLQVIRPQICLSH